MSDAKLPPGPWRAELDEDGNPVEIVARGGQRLIWPYYTAEYLGVISPEVLRAVCALPLLVEAAREVLMLTRKVDAPWAAIGRMADALAAIDGEGTDDGPPG